MVHDSVVLVQPHSKLGRHDLNELPREEEVSVYEEINKMKERNQFMRN